MDKCGEVVNEDVFKTILAGGGAPGAMLKVRAAGSGASLSTPVAAAASGSSADKGGVCAGGGGSSSSDAELLAKYQLYLLQSYVDINSGIKWCPGKECGSAISASGAVTAVKCSCGQSFW